MDGRLGPLCPDCSAEPDSNPNHDPDPKSDLPIRWYRLIKKYCRAFTTLTLALTVALVLTLTETAALPDANPDPDLNPEP